MYIHMCTHVLVYYLSTIFLSTGILKFAFLAKVEALRIPFQDPMEKCTICDWENSRDLTTGAIFNSEK